MSLFKKEERYDGETSGKGVTFCCMLKRLVHNIGNILKKMCGKKIESHYDLDVDDDTSPKPYQRKQMICNIIFLVYGVIAGWIGQQYVEYECRAFQAFACGMSLTSPDLYTTPLTILVNIVIIFTVYLSISVIWGCMYFGLKKFWIGDNDEEEVEMLQDAAMYGLLMIVFVSLFFFALPFNMFIFVYS